MRNPNPVEGVPMDARYDGATQPRYDDAADYHKGPAGTYNFVGVTLEEEVRMGGWLPNARPTTTEPYMQGNDRQPVSAAPRDLMTIGMRGEPDLDDDPAFTPDGKVQH